LITQLPELMYQLPRRNALRVRQGGGLATPAEPAAPTGQPKARLRHPALPPEHAQELTLQLLDVSHSGCALLLPHAVPAMPLGMVLRQVEVELDDDTIIFCDLLVHHSTPHSRRERSLRVGCEWRGLAPAAQLRLRDWIDKGRRRRSLISIALPE
jgi:flagellar brake protein